jgi:hypothetical protein
MPRVPEFYSVNEYKKPNDEQVHHNNGKCGAGKSIPLHERLSGTGGYRLCKDCAELNRNGE